MYPGLTQILDERVAIISTRTSHEREGRSLGERQATNQHWYWRWDHFDLPFALRETLPGVCLFPHGESNCQVKCEGIELRATASPNGAPTRLVRAFRKHWHVKIRLIARLLYNRFRVFGSVKDGEFSVARQPSSQRALADLQSQIERTLNNSPLQSLGKELSILLTGSKNAVHEGVARLGQEADVVNYVRQRFHALPTSFGDRFLIDSAIISEIAAECSAGGLRLSNMLVPKYATEWGHQRVDIICHDDSTHFVDVILVAGYDDVRSMHLLEYPWLCHELGHNIHFRSDRFSELFSPHVGRQVSRLRARSIADRGVSRERSRSRIDQFHRVWHPSRNQKNWAHEIAVDIVALWLCGPAYLAAFSHLLADRKPPPFHITQDHPPYDVRLAAVIDAAERLGWTAYTRSLVKVQENWRHDENNSALTNEYLALRDSELICTNVTTALTVCEEFMLPRFDETRIGQIRRLIQKPKECDFGIELISAAWLAESELGGASFDQWHDDVISELRDAVTR